MTYSNNNTKYFTGGTGFIGSYLTNLLNDEGHESLLSTTSTNRFTERKRPNHFYTRLSLIRLISLKKISYRANHSNH